MFPRVYWATILLANVLLLPVSTFSNDTTEYTKAPYNVSSSKIVTSLAEENDTDTSRIRVSFGGHRHQHHSYRTTTNSPFKGGQGPIILAPSQPFYLANETVEFTCFAFYGQNITWSTSFGRHQYYWRYGRGPRYSPVEMFEEFFSVHDSVRSPDFDDQVVISVSVRMDPSLNGTTLRCSVVGQKWVEDTVSIDVRRLPKELGEECSKMDECPENSMCDNGVCECDRFHSRHNHGKVCVPSKVGLGDACIRNSNCPSNAICDRLCICDYSHVERFVNGDLLCVAPRQFLQYCHYDEECQLSDARSVCKNHLCNCATGYVHTDGKCWKKIWLGDPCTKNEDCSAIVEHSICRNVTSGGFAECSCEIGHRISGRRCVAHWKDNMVSLRMYFIICASTLGFILLCIFVCGIKSARNYVLQTKGRHCRNTIANEKNLSISKYIPMKSKPEIKVLEEKDSVTFCPLPSLNELTWKPNQGPELRPVSISEQDKTVGIPENKILIQKRNSSAC